MKKINNIPTATGFDIPNGYFEDLQERMEAQVQLDCALHYVTKTCYEVPPSYFEELPKRIKVEEAHSPNATSVGRIISLRKVVSISIAVAAGLLLLFTVVTFTKGTTNISSLDRLVIQEYLESLDLQNLEDDLELAVFAEGDNFLLEDFKLSDDNLLEYIQKETDLNDFNLD